MGVTKAMYIRNYRTYHRDIIRRASMHGIDMIACNVRGQSFHAPVCRWFDNGIDNGIAIRKREIDRVKVWPRPVGESGVGIVVHGLKVVAHTFVPLIIDRLELLGARLSAASTTVVGYNRSCSDRSTGPPGSLARADGKEHHYCEPADPTLTCEARYLQPKLVVLGQDDIPEINARIISVNLERVGRHLSLMRPCAAMDYPAGPKPMGQPEASRFKATAWFTLDANNIATIPHHRERQQDLEKRPASSTMNDAGGTTVSTRIPLSRRRWAAFER